MSCSTINTVMPRTVRMSWIQNAMSSVSSTLSPTRLVEEQEPRPGAECPRHLDDLADA